MAEARAGPSGAVARGLAAARRWASGADLAHTVAKRSRPLALVLRPPLSPRNQPQLFYHLVYQQPVQTHCLAECEECLCRQPAARRPVPQQRLLAPGINGSRP